jgi:small subunit ribosomal protein S20
MANIKSAKKRVLVSKKANASNKSQKSELKTLLKKANADGADSAAILTAIKKTDRAAGKGLIHKNKAARIKSRLAKKEVSA